MPDPDPLKRTLTSKEEIEMGEMVQQVGNAILTVMVQEVNEAAYAGGLASDRVIEKIARAAIEAMREPTPEMTKAARLRWNAGHDKTAWRLMIDAALAEK